MNYILSGIIFCPVIAGAQTFSYPKLNKAGSDIAELVPPKWTVIATAYGDLNNDQTTDLAMVLEYQQPVSEVRAYGDNETELIREFQKPRILVIYARQQNDSYTFLTQNNHFILRSQEGGQLGDPFKKISIDSNRLQLAFEGGSNWQWKLRYTFQYQNKTWNLVAAMHTDYHFGSGELIEKQYDFIGRRIYITTGSLFNRSIANKTTEEVLYFGRVKTFSTFKKPWTWEITKDNFL